MATWHRGARGRARGKRRGAARGWAGEGAGWHKAEEGSGCCRRDGRGGAALPGTSASGPEEIRSPSARRARAHGQAEERKAGRRAQKPRSGSPDPKGAPLAGRQVGEFSIPVSRTPKWSTPDPRCEAPLPDVSAFGDKCAGLGERANLFGAACWGSKRTMPASWGAPGLGAPRFALPVPTLSPWWLAGLPEARTVVMAERLAPRERLHQRAPGCCRLGCQRLSAPVSVRGNFQLSRTPGNPRLGGPSGRRLRALPPGHQPGSQLFVPWRSRTSDWCRGGSFLLLSPRQRDRDAGTPESCDSPSPPPPGRRCPVGKGRAL